MGTIRWKLSAIPSNSWFALKRQWAKIVMLRNSLFYNHFTNRTYIVDVLMEPIFWFVDNFTKVLGPFFVLCVCLLTASVVIISYSIGLPYYWEKSPLVTVFLLTLGHWLLLNVCFHYYMAATTLPGQPPEGILIPEAASMCKKCIAPKPPRTHHCSICNKCILKMDHHCPWLDNCVGHYNHRYFFMYMVYTCLGVLFIILFGFEIAYDEVWLGPELEPSGHSVRFNHSVMIAVDEDLSETDSDQTLRRRCIIYMAFICSGVFVSLGSLSLWHCKLIGRGESSVETIINLQETKRFASQNKKYVNPYDLGAKRNWQLFLGLVDGRTWPGHILFPSRHAPSGDGLTWPTIYSERETELSSVKDDERTESSTTPVFQLVKRKKKTIEYNGDLIVGETNPSLYSSTNENDCDR